MGDVTIKSDHKGYLLDTHTFLWALKNPTRLSEQARTILEDVASNLYLSSISAFEVMNKQRLGKLSSSYRLVTENYTLFAQRLGVRELTLSTAHCYLAGNMEWDHRDPFDRFIVAQASLENLAIITKDIHIAAHPWVETVW
jgi:PIN domain nuclease of toxin-antitoxin system